jgi:hypothetical protein
VTGVGLGTVDVIGVVDFEAGRVVLATGFGVLDVGWVDEAISFAAGTGVFVIGFAAVLVS